MCFSGKDDCIMKFVGLIKDCFGFFNAPLAQCHTNVFLRQPILSTKWVNGKADNSIAVRNRSEQITNRNRNDRVSGTCSILVKVGVSEIPAFSGFVFEGNKLEISLVVRFSNDLAGYDKVCAVINLVEDAT